MFKIVVLQVIVSAVVASPIYPGGMGYGGMGTSTSTVSVRRTSVLSPGVYGGGMMPGMGVGVVSGVYGTGSMGMLVDEKSTAEAGVEPVEETIVEEKKEIVGPNGAAVETVVEKQVETPLGEEVEVVKTMENQSPMGLLKSGVAEQKPKAVRTGLGGVEKTSVSLTS